MGPYMFLGANLLSSELDIGIRGLGQKEISEDEAEDPLQDAIQEKFSIFGDKEHQAIDILLAKIDIYELFAFKHCKGRNTKLALCEELDERMRDLKNELQSFEGDEYDESDKRKAIEALKRMESWNLFSDTYEEFQNYTVARDAFLTHLGSMLWGSVRHIISPSIADGAFHHYEKISFQLYFITQEKVRNIKLLPVDLKAINDGLSSVLLDNTHRTTIHFIYICQTEPKLEPTVTPKASIYELEKQKNIGRFYICRGFISEMNGVLITCTHMLATCFT